jgi:hypothetical protein
MLALCQRLQACVCNRSNAPLPHALIHQLLVHYTRTGDSHDSLNVRVWDTLSEESGSVIRSFKWYFQSLYVLWPL